MVRASKSIPVFFVAVLFLLTSCSKNLTNYFADEQAPGLSIFSDKGNNILSCYINGRPWRTFDRLLYTTSMRYELSIDKLSDNGDKDTILFTWKGNFEDSNVIENMLTLTLYLKKDFSYNDFSLLQGQRILIDSTVNGYFSTDINGTNIQWKGNGAIYFNRAIFDSTGVISGLFETTINEIKFTKGRFDEELSFGNTHL